MKLLSLLLTGTLFSLSACGFSLTNTDSKVQHIFGKTFRARSAPLIPCNKFVEYEESLKPFANYLQKLAQHIISKNTATFQKEIDGSKLCITLRKSKGTVAFTREETGMVRVDLGAFLVMNSDADMASLLSRELAHIAMGHGVETLIPPFEPPELYDDVTWRQMKLEYEAFAGERKKEKDKLLTEAQPYYAFRREVVNEFEQITSAPLMAAREKLEELIEKAFEDQENIQAQLMDTRAKLEALKKTVPDDDTAREVLDSAINATIFLEKELTASDDEVEERYLELLREQAKLQAQIDREAWSFAYKKTPPFLRKKWDNNEAKIKHYEAAMAEQDNLINAAWEQLQSYLYTATQTHYLPRAWLDVEADEVGFELFLRAGFHKDEYRAHLLRKMKQEERDACMPSLQNGAPMPDAGMNGTPRACWSLYNIRWLELVRHATEYAPLIDKASVVEIFPGELAQLKMQAETLLQ